MVLAHFASAQATRPRAGGGLAGEALAGQGGEVLVQGLLLRGEALGEGVALAGFQMVGVDDDGA